MEVIATSISSILGTIGNIITSNNARKAAYQNWLSQAVPTYTDVFGNYKSQEDQSNLTIIGILAGLTLILIIAIVIKKQTT